MEVAPRNVFSLTIMKIFIKVDSVGCNVYSETMNVPPIVDLFTLGNPKRLNVFFALCVRVRENTAAAFHRELFPMRRHQKSSSVVRCYEWKWKLLIHDNKLLPLLMWLITAIYFYLHFFSLNLFCTLLGH